ncbi:MAG: succinate dehydrogenase cytochrome b subunit [Cyclonatronaceae bacterium]
MPSLLNALQTTVGRKILTGVTGIFLTLFLVVHLAGNFSLFSADPEAFNAYTEFLHSLGRLLYIVEIILVIIFLLHAYIGISIWLRKRKARPEKYDVYKTSGEPSRQTLASRTMAITGVVILVFTIVHLFTFKWGPGIADGYVTYIDGQEVRDLKRLVNDVFQNEIYVIGYTAVMILIGFHLRHGVWSSLQSLGAMSPKMSPVIYIIGGLIALALAGGFLIVPIWIYITGGV